MYYLLALGGGDGCGMMVGGRAVAGIVRVVYWDCAGGADGAGGRCTGDGLHFCRRAMLFDIDYTRGNKKCNFFGGWVVSLVY